ncbi:MAG TPA: flagellar biosynthetic protein FliR [Polyangiales bacterium]|nr:flagellar biosynthetic protein FliR [Polyangiales bacterium]
MPGPFAQLAEMLPLFVLASIRIALTMAGLPAPFGGVAPTSIRTALSVVLSIALCVPLLGTLPPIAADAVSLGRAAACELLIGSVMGLTVRVTLAATEIAGTLAGQAMGLGFASSVDPTHGESILPTTYLFGALATVIFFAFNGHHVVVAALSESFVRVPVGQPLPAAVRNSALLIGTDLVARGLQIAAPVVATMFIVQLGVSFVARTAQKVHLFAFFFSVTVAAGLLVMWVAAPSLTTAIAAQVRRLPDAIYALGTR